MSCTRARLYPKHIGQILDVLMDCFKVCLEATILIQLFATNTTLISSEIFMDIS